MEILLDTNFLIACVAQKIDFNTVANEEISDKIEWAVPWEVLEELKEISTRKGEKVVDRDAAKIALELTRVMAIKIISLGPKTNNVDEAIKKYISGRNIVLATLDRGLKKSVKNQILTIRGLKRLELI